MLKNILKQKLLLITRALLFVLFIVILILVKAVDEKTIGDSQSLVGLGSINESVFNKLGKNENLSKVTDVIFGLSFGVVAFMACLGLYRLVKEKKLDLTLVILGAFYVLLAVTYLVFEIIHINYAPLLKNGEPKDSFPSSHVFISVFILLSAIIVTNINIKKPVIRYTLIGIAVLLSVLMVVFRLLSGWHWFSDILAGEALALFYVLLYTLIIASLEKKTIKIGKKNEEELH